MKELKKSEFSNSTPEDHPPGVGGGAERQADFEHQAFSPISLQATIPCLLSPSLYKSDFPKALHCRAGRHLRSHGHWYIVGSHALTYCPTCLAIFITNAKGSLRSSKLTPPSPPSASQLYVHL